MNGFYHAVRIGENRIQHPFLQEMEKVRLFLIRTVNVGFGIGMFLLKKLYEIKTRNSNISSINDGRWVIK